MADRQGRNGSDSRRRMQPDVVVARVVGILCIASGFVAGIQGLEQRDSFWLPTALGLIVTGLLAQAYAFYSLLRRRLGKSK
ncbi:hypothetical protein [Nitrospira sp. Kam-Ns4a]